MSKPRLTRQRYDTLINAMAYWETYLEDMESDEELLSDTSNSRQLRREYDSAMEWLWAMGKQSGVS